MITWELFKAIESYLYEDGEITDSQLKDFSRYCSNLHENHYSRGGRNYVTIETESLGKVSLCNKKVNLFRKIITLCLRLEKVDVHNRPFEDWLNHFCYCNDVIYKKVN